MMIQLMALSTLFSTASADEKVFLGTGSVDPIYINGLGAPVPLDQYWLHTFDDTTLQDCGSTVYTSDWVTEMNEDFNNTTSIDRVWPHAFWYSAANDTLFTALIYSNKLTYTTLDGVPNPGSGTTWAGDIGGVAIYYGASTMTSAATPDYHLFSGSSGVDMPHSLAVDDLGELLYVANTQNGGTVNGSVLVWENAFGLSTIPSPAADYSVTHLIDHPVDVHYDASTDTLVVVNFDPGTTPEVIFYFDVSADLTGSGSTEADVRMTFSGVTTFIHETWYFGAEDMLFFTTRGDDLHRKDMSAYLGYPAVGCNIFGSGSCPSGCNYSIGGYLNCTSIATDADIDVTGGGTLGGFGLYVDETNDVAWVLGSEDNHTGAERVFKFSGATTLTTGDPPDLEVCWDEVGSDDWITQGLWVLEI